MEEAEDLQSGSAGAEATNASAVDPIAVALALNGASREKADAFLDRQIVLTNVQIEHLAQIEHFEHSHLRWRRFNDAMKGGLQIVALLAGLVLVAAVAAAMWNASQAEGLVVEAFSVPSVFAQAGIGGDAVADDITGRIATIREIANQNSLGRSADVRQESGEEIKVEIPETGISLSQAWRYLRQWLGRERHLSGNLRQTENGRIALTVALDGVPFTAEGARGELDKLDQQAAEHVFADVNPSNIVLYLLSQGRGPEALAAARRNVELAANSDPSLQAAAYAPWAVSTRLVLGDPVLARQRALTGIAIDPRQINPQREVMIAAHDLGHDEESLAQARLIEGLRREDQVAAYREAGFPRVVGVTRLSHADLLGDFARILSIPCVRPCNQASERMQRAEYSARLHDIARARMLIAEGAALGATAADMGRAHYFTDMAQGDWGAAAGDAAIAGVDWASRYRVGWDLLPMTRLMTQLNATQSRPRQALALAASGDFAAAHRLLDATPGDCYFCLRMRGAVDALEKNWGGADYWFRRAVAAAPSLPLAHDDWGRMLLAKGDAVGAATQFKIANQKGPHFADPIEMWGEALMAKNQSHLALAKFAEAEKYAPNWGRLHLKWGEALVYAGNKDEVAKQFARAAQLDLTPSEKAELGRLNSNRVLQQ